MAGEAGRSIPLTDLARGISNRRSWVATRPRDSRFPQSGIRSQSGPAFPRDACQPPARPADWGQGFPRTITGEAASVQWDWKQVNTLPEVEVRKKPRRLSSHQRDGERCRLSLPRIKAFD